MSTHTPPPSMDRSAEAHSVTPAAAGSGVRDQGGWFQLAVVCGASFVVWVGAGAILPYLPVFLQEQAHASVWLIGVVAAAYYVGTFAFASPLGLLSDRLGRRPLILGGVALYAFATLLFVTTTRPAWFVLFRLLEGMGAAAVQPAAQALIADITPEGRRSRAYGWLTTAQFGGLVAGPAVAWPLYELGGGQGRGAFYAIFLFGSGLALLTAIVLALTLQEPAHTAERRRDPTRRPPYRALVTRPILAFLVIAATGHFAMGAWEVLWSLWLRHLGASMSFVGLTWIAFSTPLLFSFLGGRLADRHSRYVLMFAGLTIAALAWITYGIMRNLTLFLVVSVIEGFATALALPAKQAFLVQVSPRRWLGAIQGLESTAMQLAAFTGTLASPLLYQVISGYAIGVGGVIALIGLAFAAPTLRGEWRRLAPARGQPTHPAGMAHPHAGELGLAPVASAREPRRKAEG
ncbi:MAG: MFS transporter [Thermoleophilia bacterium]